LKGLIFVSLEFFSDLFTSVREQVKDIVADIIELPHDPASRSTDNILGLRRANHLELDAGLALNHLDLALSLLREEGDASARVSGTCGTAGPVNIGLSVSGRLHLNDQIDIGDIEASRCDISSDQDIELALLESLESYLALVLPDISVHHLDIVLDLVSENQLIGVGFGLRENDCLA